MATVTRKIEVCDACRDVNKPVAEHVRMARDGGRLRTYAFCEGDLRPIQKILDAIAAAAPDSLGKRGGSKQVTMEQIGEIKAARRGRPRKTAAKAAI